MLYPFLTQTITIKGVFFFSPGALPTANPRTVGVEHAENILFCDILKEIVPNKFASYVFITLLAD